MDLDETDLRLLWALSVRRSKADDYATPRQLSAMRRIDARTASNRLRELEQEGLVESQPTSAQFKLAERPSPTGEPPEDTWYRLTEEGRKVLDAS